MERAYLQYTPMGDHVSAYLEAEGDVLEAFGKPTSSDVDIDRYMAKAARDSTPARGRPSQGVTRRLAGSLSAGNGTRCHRRWISPRSPARRRGSGARFK